MKKKYTILAGLWCSRQQPPMFNYLRPILERCAALQHKGILYRDMLRISVTFSILATGIEVCIGSEQTKATCRAMVLCLTVDLPAKAKILDATQYNGQFVKVGRGSTRVFEYSEPPPPMRTHSECYSHGAKAVRNKKVRKLLLKIL